MNKTEHDVGYYLNKMANFARERAAHTGGYKPAELARNYRYIRIGGNGFRAISIDPRHPCGALEGIATSNAKFDKAFARFDALPKGGAIGDSGDRKPEHRLQAYLIQRALATPGTMPHLLACDDIFDELWFITDELKLGDIRADMVFLGRKGTQYFPVLLELKVNRALGRLIEQLDGAERALKTFNREAVDFLTWAIRPILELKCEQIDISRGHCLIVWPSLQDSRKASVRVGEWAGSNCHHVLTFPRSRLEALKDRGAEMTFVRENPITLSNG